MTDKVVPIRPPVAALELQGEPYKGPAEAIRDLLVKHDFESNVVDKGWIEVRIVARFTENGCIVHTLQARQVDMTPADAPAVILLKGIAKTNEWPDDALLSRASSEDLDTLNRLMGGFTQDELISVVLEENPGKPVPQQVQDILVALCSKYEEERP